jgi:transposase, IS30 family
MKQYKHLTIIERENLSWYLARRWKLSDIAKAMGRDKSTISREISGSGLTKFSYRAHTAHAKVLERADQPKKQRKIFQNPLLQEYIHNHLKIGWSPEEIAGRVKLEYPNNPSMHISHESIYTYLYVLPRGELKRQLLSYLAKSHRKRLKRGNSHSKRGQIPNMISIEERPKEVEERIVPGHWEGDLIIGKSHKSALGTLAERTTRTVILVPLKGNYDATVVRKAFAKEVKKLPEQMKLSLTYDRGKEMAEHELFTKDTKVQVYFAHPQSPWERGTNENTNGLVRRFFPKGTDFSKIKRKEIKAVQDSLNGRPRKVLKWLTPIEVIEDLLH